MTPTYDTICARLRNEVMAPKPDEAAIRNYITLLDNEVPIEKNHKTKALIYVNAQSGRIGGSFRWPPVDPNWQSVQPYSFNDVLRFEYPTNVGHNAYRIRFHSYRYEQSLHIRLFDLKASHAAALINGHLIGRFRHFTSGGYHCVHIEWLR